MADVIVNHMCNTIATLDQAEAKMVASLAVDKRV